MCPFAAVGKVGELLTLPLRLCKRCFPRKPLHPPAPHLSDASVPSAHVDGFTHIAPGFTFPRSVPTLTHLLCVITVAPGDWAPRRPAGQDLSEARTPAANRRLSLEVAWRTGVPFPWGGRPQGGWWFSSLGRPSTAVGQGPTPPGAGHHVGAQSGSFIPLNPE